MAARYSTTWVVTPHTLVRPHLPGNGMCESCTQVDAYGVRALTRGIPNHQVIYDDWGLPDPATSEASVQTSGDNSPELGRYFIHVTI